MCRGSWGRYPKTPLGGIDLCSREGLCWGGGICTGCPRDQHSGCIGGDQTAWVWTYAADMDGQNWCSVDYKGPVALVIGSEGFGVSRLVKEKCDFVISLPMKGKINSLNASVACGVICYEVARQRSGIVTK